VYRPGRFREPPAKSSIAFEQRTPSHGFHSVIVKDQIPGTSMISFVKGKTEISLNFPNCIVAAGQLFFMKLRQLLIPVRRKFGSFDQLGLQVLVPFFRDRAALFFPRRLVLTAA
jgi:hypothetical protein